LSLPARLNGWLRRVPVWPIYLAGFIPAAVYFYWAVTNELGADPLQALERRLGLWTLQLLMLTLLVTPVLKLSGVTLVRFRRAFGLMTFYYACLHLLTWLVLDKQFFWHEIIADLYKRPYIMIGMTALAILSILAATSNSWAIRRLGGKKWKNLHRLSYVAVVLGAVHYLLVVKAWPIQPILYVTGAVLLVLSRLIWGGFPLLRHKKRLFRRGSTP